eukprot:4911904-Amphidinium_carterae.1
MCDVLRDGSTWLYMEETDRVIRASKPAEIAFDPKTVGQVTVGDVQRPCWKPFLLPNSRKCWIHIPTWKASFDNPLYVVPIEPLDVEGTEPLHEDIGVTLKNMEYTSEEVELAENSGAYKNISLMDVPLAPGRTNVRTSVPLHSMVLGASTNRGGGITTATRERTRELEVLH